MVTATPKPRRLIVTAREARALLAGATQVRRPIDVPEWATALTLFDGALLRADNGERYEMVRMPLVAGQRYYGAEPWCVIDVADTPLGNIQIGYTSGRGDFDRVWIHAPANDVERLSGARFSHKARSAATMPRWASRLSLLVESVRVERVQDATEEDARAMGVRPLPLQEGEPGCWYSADAATPGMHARDAIGALRKAWDAEHPRAPWAANGWVAVGTVRRIQ